LSTIDGKLLKRMWVDETPSGTINGSNTAFTLSTAPLENAAVDLYQDGLKLVDGTDYTLSSTSITMTTAPALGQSLRATFVQKSGGS
jgi:hypothetical protein